MTSVYPHLCKRITALLACPVLLTACAVGPDYRRPDVATPTQFRSAETASRSGTAAAPASATLSTDAWWQGFNDPVLDQLVAEGLRNNRDLQSAIANVIKARGALITTRSQFFPQLGYNGSAQRGNSPSTSLSMANPPVMSLGSFAIPASWQLDVFGGLRRQYEVASANEAAAIAQRQAAALSVSGEVVNMYVTLRSLDQQLAVARKTLENYKTTLNIFNLRYRYGTANMVQVSQIQSQVDTAEAAIPPLVKAIGQQENDLSFLLGRNPGPIPRGKPIDQLSIPLPPAGLPSELLERRPDLRLAEQQLIAANAQIGAVKAQFFPTISLTGTIGTSSSALGSLFTGPSSIWGVGAGIAGPLFNGGQIYGQYVGAKADQQIAFTQYLRNVESAFRDTDNALIATTEMRKLVQARKKQVATLTTYADLSSMQFDYGYADYLTVLNAENSLFQAQLNLATSQADQAIAQVNLYMALGGGWQTADEHTMAANKAIADGEDPHNPVNQ